jgi:hypothetical protein
VNAIVFILLIGAIIAILVGVLTSILAVLPPRRTSETDEDKFGPVYWGYSLWTIALGIFLILSPKYFFGPSWSYFKELPHDGSGMGYCCLALGSVTLIALWRNANDAIVSMLLFLIGFVLNASGTLLFAEGLLGHQGLMEGPFMIFTGGQAFIHSAVLSVRHRTKRKAKDGEK